LLIIIFEKLTNH